MRLRAYQSMKSAVVDMGISEGERRTLERRAIPTGECGRAIVGAVDEGLNGGLRIRSRAHGVVRQDELAHLAMVIRGRRLDGCVLHSCGLRYRIRVERGFEDGSAPRPEAMTDDFVRIRVAHEARALTRWCQASRESRHGEIEASPEEMHRARLADELRAPLGDDGRTAGKDLPASVRRFGVVGVMDRVVLEPDRIRDLHGHGPDANAESHA